jgi:hypothetical protein
MYPVVNNREAAMQWLQGQGKTGYIRILRYGDTTPIWRIGEDGETPAGDILAMVKTNIEMLPYGQYKLVVQASKGSSTSQTSYDFINQSGPYGHMMMPGMVPGQNPGIGNTNPVTQDDVRKAVAEALEKDRRDRELKDLKKELKKLKGENDKQKEDLKNARTLGKLAKVGGALLMASDKPEVQGMGALLAGLVPEEDPAGGRVASHQERTRTRQTTDDDDDETQDDDDPEEDMSERFETAIDALEQKGMTEDQIVSSTEALGDLADKIGPDQTAAALAKIAAMPADKLNALIPML